MWIRRAVLALFSALLGVFMTWRIAVRPSRLVIDSDEVHFPTVSGSNLEREERVFPRDFAGDLNLIFIAFLQEQQRTINTWIPFVQELEASQPGVVYYELPTIDRMSLLAHTFINEGMRAGIPDDTARERTVSLYIDTQTFMQATAIPDKRDIHILLVNRAGDILWRTTGAFSEAKGQELIESIESSSELRAH